MRVSAESQRRRNLFIDTGYRLLDIGAVLMGLTIMAGWLDLLYLQKVLACSAISVGSASLVCVGAYCLERQFPH